MSIRVDHLTKVYGSQKALDDISFEAPKGMITGFLGPNGAGKSTTMKIATGYLAATSGTVRIGDLDVAVNPIAVKKATGYLPEHNPLYLQMYVQEYLSFIGSAYRLSNLKNRISEMIDLCGLEKEFGKRIGALSKGYRQRVGLAQALIHDPEVLILDEPTSGLDPNQLIEIRKVIREAGSNKTVILSTHIMQEVEALCDRVVIINNGSIAADDSVANVLSSGKDQVRYRVEFDAPVASALFSKANLLVESVGNEEVLMISANKDARKKILKIATENDLPLVSISEQKQSLESVFQELTKGK